MKWVRNNIFLLISIFLSINIYSQNLKRYTATGLPAFALKYVTDVEQIQNGNARVFSYGFLDDNNLNCVSLVKVDNNSNIIFNKKISLLNKYLYCQEIASAGDKIILLLLYKDNFLSNNYKTVLAKVDINTGNLISAELFDGYSLNDNNIAVDLCVNLVEQGEYEIGILAYGYNNDPNNRSSKVYVILRNETIPNLSTKVLEFYNPTISDAIVYPSNIIFNHLYYTTNPSTYHLRIQFGGIYEELTTPSSRKIIFAENISYPITSVSTYVSMMKVDNKLPSDINMGYWDAIIYLWGQNMQLVSGGKGDFFYGRVIYDTPLSDINTYNNYYFDFIPSKKGLNDHESPHQTPTGYGFPFAGIYETYNSNAGFLQGSLDYGVPSTEIISELNKYTLRADHASYSYRIGSNYGKVAGIANRVGADTRQFYFWNDKELTCVNQALFSQEPKPISYFTNNGYLFSETTLNVSPVSLTINYGPDLTIEDICDDSYFVRDSSFDESQKKIAQFIPQLPLNVDSWKNNNFYESENNLILSTKKDIISREHEVFTVFPNPTSNHVTIQSKKGLISQLEVFDSKGSMVFGKSIKSSTYTIDVSSWGKGLFFIKYYANNSFRVGKFLVQ